MPYITDFYVVSTLVLFLLLNGILLFFLLRKITSFEKIYVEKITETNEYLKKLIVENKKLNKSEEEKI
ncbi:hypothetical protein NIES4106_23680 [Fischerella sp. NIES-4106]|nr:hypothetical protein NIES4106_23680 [Fischerella sp. NIES-4106]